MLLHAQTRASLGRLVTNRPHAVLLVGQPGAGKYYTGLWFLSQALDTKSLTNSPYFLHLSAPNGSVGIESIRELQAFLQLKTAGDKPLRRAVLLENADSMSSEAQNALLKVLEEPPEDTILVLTAGQPQNLKPTIHSRVQAVTLLPVGKQETIDYFGIQGHGESDITKAHSLSNGQVGLITSLLDTTEQHDLKDKITLAKELYGMQPFERLCKVDELAKQKDELPLLLYACKRICVSALEQAALRDQQSAAKAWYRQLHLIAQAEQDLSRNPNPKLFLTDLFISI